ncbi:cupin domain-containing protein [Halorarius halobius]|uniref:cupin domain-containing protein n=1 Tax=Halorarius halobius TaxID=2962671 RepID=UPI0020CDE8C6|nr:cupin domain-containing protein [Halorarius halobius]
MPEYTTLEVSSLPDAPSPTDGKKEIDEAVGATAFGLNLYTAAPGQQASMGYHHHPDHEELFYVLDGELTFETPDGEFAVGAGEVFFVPPGAPQKGRATSDTPARFLAVGAPKAEDHATIVEHCPDCGTETERDLAMEDGVAVVSCADCGTVTDRFTAGPD